MRSSPCHNLGIPAGALVTIHFSLQVRLGKCKTVLIIISFKSEHFKSERTKIFLRTRCNRLFFFSWEYLDSKQNQTLRLSPSNCFMLIIIPSLQSRCNMLNNQFYFEHGVENGCVATINLYEETIGRICSQGISSRKSTCNVIHALNGALSFPCLV